MVKRIIIANAIVYVGLILIVQRYFLPEPYFFRYLGLTPGAFIFDFFLWQPFTYMFIHSYSFFHILFNMLILWMFGSELELRWGSRFFLTYYLVCGAGAAILYSFITLGYYLVTNNIAPMLEPVIGASGAVYGMILAYGLVFGERTILFMFVFPMAAKYFALILGVIELLSLLSSGYGSEVSNLCHLGGIATGFLFLWGFTRWKNRRVKKPQRKNGRRLKLVVDNERKEDSLNGPRYWN